MGFTRFKQIPPRETIHFWPFWSFSFWHFPPHSLDSSLIWQQQEQLDESSSMTTSMLMLRLPRLSRLPQSSPALPVSGSTGFLLALLMSRSTGLLLVLLVSLLPESFLVLRSLLPGLFLMLLLLRSSRPMPGLSLVLLLLRSSRPMLTFSKPLSTSAHPRKGTYCEVGTSLNLLRSGLPPISNRASASCLSRGRCSYSCQT